MLDVGQVNELKLAFRRFNWTNEDIKKFSEADTALGDGVRGVIRGTHEIKQKEKVILPIPASLTLADRIARGKYNWVNSDITEKHFPTNIPADYDAEYRLFHFNRDISSENAIKEMEKEGYRPAILPELLILGETQPELQKEFQIVALGSVWRDSYDHRYVPILHWYGRRRKLNLLWFELDWYGYFRFLAVRK